MEEWRDIVGYEGLYQVSNCGRVKALNRIDSNNRKHKERVLKQPKTPSGYSHVHLSKENKSRWVLVHRIVAEAYIDKPDGCNVVNHIDNNPSNNHVNNLEWTTFKGNMQWASIQGRMHGNIENVKKAVESRKRAVIATDKNGNEHAFTSQTEAARVLGVNRGHIAQACHKAYGYKTLGGYEWKYAYDMENQHG